MSRKVLPLITVVLKSIKWSCLLSIALNLCEVRVDLILPSLDLWQTVTWCLLAHTVSNNVTHEVRQLQISVYFFEAKRLISTGDQILLSLISV